MFKVYNLLNGKGFTTDSLKEVFDYVKKEREVLVSDTFKGHVVHFKDGVKIGSNFEK